MDVETGRFTSMDSYAGSIFDPVSLHKYLYANANPVMYTDPSGYTSVLEAAIGQIIQSAFIGAYLSFGMSLYPKMREKDATGKDINWSEVFSDTIFGAEIAGAMTLIYIIAAYSGSVLALAALGCVNLYFTILMIEATVMSLEDHDYGMAALYAICGGFAALGTKNCFDNANQISAAKSAAKSTTNSNVGNTRTSSGKYQDASLLERMTIRKAGTNELYASPSDDFSDPKVGPSDSTVSKYIMEINQYGKISKPIEVQKLSDGGYEIVNGHHRWLAAIKTGLEEVPIRIKNYSN